jgi:hypothetical protein
VLAKVQSCAVVGLDATPVHVEVDIARGLERLTVSSISIRTSPIIPIDAQNFRR